MSRTAEELMTHYIESMMNLSKDSNLDDALIDYSEELVAITPVRQADKNYGARYPD